MWLFFYLLLLLVNFVRNIVSNPYFGFAFESCCSLLNLICMFWVDDYCCWTGSLSSGAVWAGHFQTKPKAIQNPWRITWIFIICLLGSILRPALLFPHLKFLTFHFRHLFLLPPKSLLCFLSNEIPKMLGAAMCSDMQLYLLISLAEKGSGLWEVNGGLMVRLSEKYFTGCWINWDVWPLVLLLPFSWYLEHRLDGWRCSDHLAPMRHFWG